MKFLVKLFFASLIFSFLPFINTYGVETRFPASMVSNTIPVVYINTAEGQNIVDKVTPVSAGFVLDPTISEYEGVGTWEQPLEMTIRGRGNYTWKQAKKPYKLKFSEKVSLCGLPKSKHYALLAHIVNTSHVWADNEMAYEMARIIGMPWAPHTVPVELVLNGEYLGVYFLSETIRIEKNRLNIFEQEDGETDSEIIPYGWLIELDNSGGNLKIQEKENLTLRFTFHSPENLSDEQWSFISQEMQTLTDAIYDEDNPDKWTEYFDAKSLAQYFIIREILHDSDAYSGSFYFYKDKEENAKWHFGPLWDCTNQSQYKSRYLFQNPDVRVCWLSKIVLSPAFERAVREEWTSFYNTENLEKVMNHLEDYSSNLDLAFEASNLRWKDADIQLYYRKGHLASLKQALYNNTSWINDHLNINDIAQAYIESSLILDSKIKPSITKYFKIDGTPLLSNPTAPGLYIYKQGDDVGKILIK